MAKKLNQTEEYIDFNKLLGHQKLFYMILTDRGFGKSFATKRHLINDFLKRGKKFIYLRRYKDEMKLITTFFDDVQDYYPNHTFKVKGWNLYIDDKLCGVGLILSRYQNYKGGAFPDYDNLLFDEFLREKVKSVGYLNNDTEAFLSICDTVFRKRSGVKAILLSNTVNEVNPYFIDFKINRLNNSEYAYSQLPEVRDKLLCYIRELDEEVKKRSQESSELRQVLGAIKKYSDVAINNKFSEDGSTFIKRKSKTAEFKVAIRISEWETYGIWFDYENVEIFVTQSYEKTTKNILAFSKETHNSKTQFVNSWKENYTMKKVITAFKNSQLYFENSTVKMTMFDLFSKLRIF